MSVHSVTWDDIEESEALFNLALDSSSPLSAGSAYSTPENIDQLPFQVSPSEARTGVAVTIVVKDQKEPPEGTIVIEYESGNDKSSLRINPSWGE